MWKLAGLSLSPSRRYFALLAMPVFDGINTHTFVSWDNLQVLSAWFLLTIHRQSNNSFKNADECLYNCPFLEFFFGYILAGSPDTSA